MIFKIFVKKNERLAKQEADRLCEYYRTEVMNDDIVNNIMPYEDFSNLVDVAKRADYGCSTAVQATFCMGYLAGKDGGNDGE